MFSSRPVREEYKPKHPYQVELREDAWGSVILTIWDENKSERLYVNCFVGDYRSNSREQARKAILPFIERHEKEGLIQDFSTERFMVVPTHVCEVEEEC